MSAYKRHSSSSSSWVIKIKTLVGSRLSSSACTTRDRTEILWQIRLTALLFAPLLPPTCPFCRPKGACLGMLARRTLSSLSRRTTMELTVLSASWTEHRCSTGTLALRIQTHNWPNTSLLTGLEMQQALLKRVLCHVILVSVAPPAPLYTTIFYIFLSRSLSLALSLSRSLHCPRCCTCLCSDAILMKAVTSRQFIHVFNRKRKEKDVFSLRFTIVTQL